MTSQDQPQQSGHGPYRPDVQVLGGTPNLYTDVPVCAVFLALFAIGAVLHMALFRRNRIKNQRFFPMNAVTFGFCLTRVVANTLRVARAHLPQNNSVAIAAQIFVYAGTPILFIGNLIFAQRIIRGQHPRFGWARPFTFFVFFFYFITVATVLTVIPIIILGFFTLNELIARQVRDVQLFALTTFTVSAVLPAILVAGSSLFSLGRSETRTESFGQGSTLAKIVIVVVTSIILTLGAAWRTTTLYLPPAPLLSSEKWYFGNWAFYIFNYTFEIFIVYFWLLVRIDERFCVPDRAEGTYQSLVQGCGDTKPDQTQQTDPGSKSRNKDKKTRASKRHLVSDWPEALVRDPGSVTWGGHCRVSVCNSLRRGDFADEVPIEAHRPGISPVPRDSGQSVDARRLCDVHGAFKKMGWNTRSGRWVLRPLSAMGPTCEGSVTEENTSVQFPSRRDCSTKTWRATHNDDGLILVSAEEGFHVPRENAYHAM